MSYVVLLDAPLFILIQPAIFWIMDFWWLWFFFAMVAFAPGLWLTYVHEYYKRANEWVLLELKVPREITRSPRAMEQVFMALHAIRNSPATIQEKWWDGEVTLWHSCEVVSFGGEIHFYMWVPSKHRNIVEATIYAHYSDIEIAESADYIDRLPFHYAELAKSGYELFGNELILEKHDAYPLRTYIDFEEKIEEYQLDPVSALLEVLAKVKPQEHVWVQILIRPTTTDEWKEEGEKELKRLKERARGITEVKGKKIEPEILMMPAPGETELMKAIDRNIGKPGFETLIRYLYISPKELYSSNFGQRGVFSAFNQYGSEALNRFRNNTKVWTRASKWFFPYVFSKQRTDARKVRIYENYRNRKMYLETRIAKFLDVKTFHFGLKAHLKRYVLNVEELATLFHPPTNVVLTGPLIKRVEARKVGPPAGLPIYGEEDEKLPGIK